MIDHICFLLEHHFSTEYMSLFHILFSSVLQFTSYGLFFWPFVFCTSYFLSLECSSHTFLLVKPYSYFLSQVGISFCQEAFSMPTPAPSKCCCLSFQKHILPQSEHVQTGWFQDLDPIYFTHSCYILSTQYCLAHSTFLTKWHCVCF